MAQQQMLKRTSPKAGTGGYPPAPASGPQQMIAQIEEQAKLLPLWALDKIATTLDQMSQDDHLRQEDAYREHRRLNDQWRSAIERDEAGEADGRRFDDWIGALESRPVIRRATHRVKCKRQKPRPNAI